MAAVQINPGSIPACQVTLRDCTQMTWQDPSYCANCYEHISFSDSKLSFKDDLSSDQTEPSIPKITLMEALDIVFDIYKKSHKTCIIFDDAYFLCQNCSLIFRNLFSLISQFTDASSAPSFLFSLIGSRRVQSKFVPLVQIKEEISDLDTFPPSVESFWDETEEPEPTDLAAEIVDKTKIVFKKTKRKKIYEATVDSNNDSAISDEEDYRRIAPKRKVSPTKALIHSDAEDNKETEAISPKRTKQSGSVFDANLHDDSSNHNSVELISEEDPQELDLETQTPEPSPSMKDTEVQEKQISVSSSGSKPRARTHVCPECNIGFTRSNHLGRHLAQHKSKDFMCQCGVGFAAEHNLKLHQKEHCKLTLNSYRPDYPQPKSSLKLKLALKKAQRKHVSKLVRRAGIIVSVNLPNAKKFACEYSECGKVFDRLNKLNRHKLVHETKPFKCKSCGYYFSDEDVLVRHMHFRCKVLHKSDKPAKKEIDSAEKEVTCDITKESVRKTKPARRRPVYACHCGETFSRTDHLRRHAEAHKVKNVVCPTCSAGFVTQVRLDKHVRIHDPSYVPPDPDNVRSLVGPDGGILEPKPKKQFPCDEMIPCTVCGKMVIRRGMKSHMISHTEERPAVCELCGVSFKTVTGLRHHQKFVHSSERPCLCNTCGRGFKQIQHLVAHEIAVHSGNRAFGCEECGKRFKWERNLRQHKELHRAEKYVCEGCGKVFTRKDNLKVHMDRSCAGTSRECPDGVEKKGWQRYKIKLSLGNSAGSETAQKPL